VTERTLRAGRRFGAALVLGLAALWFWAASANAAAPEGELVLILDRDAKRAVAARLAERLEGRLAASIPQLDAYLIDLPGQTRPGGSLLVRLREEAGVRAAEATAAVSLAEGTEPGQRVSLAVSFNDPLIGQAWHLAKIRAGDAWETTTGSPSVVIAIVDTGIDYTHPDLSGKVTLGYDYGSSDSDPKDTQGHGTHVAGIAAAKAGNGIGSAGVCPSCQLMAVKVFPDGSSSASSFAVAQGITWAVDHGADVINLSLGGTGASTVQRTAVDYAWSRGVVVVAAAGNSATSTQHFPAAFPNAIAVGSTTSADALSSFSNFGAWVDLTAPGSSILSSVMGGSYQFWSGTSMASPVVAGAAGLAFSGLAGATASSVRAALEQAVTDLGAPGKDATFGFGRLDLSRLFAGGTAPPGPTPPPPASPSITTASLPAGQVGTAYVATLTATGGQAPYTWSLAGGALPAGIVLGSSSGTLSGTPTASGTFSFTARVTGADGLSSTRALAISIAAAPVVKPDLSGSWVVATRNSSAVHGELRLTLASASVAQVTVRFQLLSWFGTVLSTKTTTLSSLAPGNRIVTVDWSGSVVSARSVRATIDPSNLVSETNEQNNTVTATLSSG
jgi:thermitase